MNYDIHALRSMGDKAQRANERARGRKDETGEVYARAIEDVLRFVTGDARPTAELVAALAPEATKLPVRHEFLDISTQMVTEAEMNTITRVPTTVMPFDEGAWLNVRPEEFEGDDTEWADHPNVRAVLAYARTMGVRYVLLDGDGLDIIPGLPTFDW